MYRIAICDDEEFTCSLLEMSLLKYSEDHGIVFETDVFWRGYELTESIRLGNDYDLIFLDIELGDSTGIEVAKAVREDYGDENVQIIIISSKTQYAMQLFRIRPMDFMVKPFSEEYIAREISRAVALVDKGNVAFEYSAGHEHYKIPCRWILYFQSDRRKISIIMENETKNFYGKIDDILMDLGEKNFWRIHKSYFVNCEHIIRYSYEWVEMKNHDVLSISRANRDKIQKLLFAQQKEKTDGQ